MLTSEINITTNNKIHYRKGYIFIISLIAALGGLMFGFDLGVITGVIPFIQNQFQLEGFALGWVVSLFEVGCIGGAFITAYLADKLGRKKSLILTALSFIITTAGVALAQSSFGIALWRFFQGIGVGAASGIISHVYCRDSPSRNPG
jgi:SP family arabinose:H+ symporter-like MFS transporter